jgi:hypothetical protein
LEVRPFRFRDGIPHPCAKVPMIRVPATSVRLRTKPQVHVLGDYLLLWIGGPAGEDYSVCKVFLIAWKEGVVTLVSTTKILASVIHND